MFLTNDRQQALHCKNGSNIQAYWTNPDYTEDDYRDDCFAKIFGDMDDGGEWGGWF